MAGRYHLAQVNIARLCAPLASPLLAGFVDALDPINALADASPGFVWRLQTQEGNATALRVLGDESLIVNLSLWESLAALTAYAYRSPHAAVMRNRRRWFHPLETYLALWWVPAGHIPTVAEAETRLLHLRAHGPSTFAFGVRSPFPPPGSEAAIQARADDVCRV